MTKYTVFPDFLLDCREGHMKLNAFVCLIACTVSKVNAQKNLLTKNVYKSWPRVFEGSESESVVSFSKFF